MAELDAQEAKIVEAEEEELWMLTLQQQSRHIVQHLEFDLPQVRWDRLSCVCFSGDSGARAARELVSLPYPPTHSRPAAPALD
jgi:hypothetical protein